MTEEATTTATPFAAQAGSEPDSDARRINRVRVGIRDAMRRRLTVGLNDTNRCPFCGSASRPEYVWSGMHQMWCAECPECGACGPYKPTGAEAMAAWHSRFCPGRNTPLDSQPATAGEQLQLGALAPGNHEPPNTKPSGGTKP